ncbi:PDZ domain-containing protein [Cynara cardunculus var. scolymus]|uniref:PDZ domain-containing protein n=1 Tax=Cynara cardunculus var. scolymus TaxID=59895 RepID=A0A118JU51_CYNCS|nr:PDZ domain-containing protein [Cynara cardunculus var. scolymus]
MATAPNSYPSICASPPLPRTLNSSTKQTLSFVTSQFKQTSHKNPQTLRFSIRLGNSNLEKQSILVVRASETDSSSTENGGEEEERYEEYEVEIEQPYGLKFAKGRDGGTYIDAIAPGGFADKTKMFSVGDRVLATSAVFGTEIWPAAEYGRTMYTIRQRIGPLLMRMQKRYGKMEDSGELTEKEIIRAERNSGVVSSKVREIQMQNYLRKKEQKETRTRDLREGLQLYKSAKFEEALEKFESVLGSKPELDEASIQAGLSALKDAMQAGYEDFKRIRTDPDLENVRKSEEFEPLMKKYDESFINENALNAIKSLFGFNKS